jgi:uncharacterized protein YjbI with pentapeptide repeats
MVADLYQAKLEKASLYGANLEKADLLEANINRAILLQTRLKGALHLSINQLSQATTLYKAELDNDLREQVEKDYPYLLKRPESSNKLVFS